MRLNARYGHICCLPILSFLNVSIVFSLKSMMPNRRWFVSTFSSIRVEETKAYSSNKNDGIRILNENSFIALIWKTSNVGIHSNKYLQRPASQQSFLEWCEARKLYAHSSLCWINEFTNGILIASKSINAQDQLLRLNTKSNCECYVQGLFNIDPNIDDTRIASLFPLESNIIVNIIQKEPSKTYGMLYLLEFTFPGLVPLMTLHELLDRLKQVGTTCVTTGSSLFLSYNGFSVREMHPLFDGLSISVENASGRNPNSFRVATLPKFLKMMKREKLFSERENSAVLPSPSVSNTEMTMFCDCEIEYSRDSLKPRVSSKYLVDTVLRYFSLLLTSKALERSDKSRYNILDLGCGSGALLIAVVKQATELMKSASSTVSGIGVDLDTPSLELAYNNSVRNLSPMESNIDIASTSISQNETYWSKPLLFTENRGEVKYIKGNFSELEHLQSGNFDTLGSTPFNLIFCNPPYFSKATVKGRVTGEGDHVLVAGESGLEAYTSILASLVRSKSSMTPLIDQNTLILFQIPSGSHRRVVLALEQHAEVVEVIFDNENVSKCIVVKLKNNK